jgi:hypothetical protein
MTGFFIYKNMRAEFDVALIFFQTKNKRSTRFSEDQVPVVVFSDCVVGKSVAASWTHMSEKPS